MSEVEVEETLRIADMAERLRAYKMSLAYSYFFVVWASVMVGLPLACLAILFSPWFGAVRTCYLVLFLTSVGLGIAISMTIMFYMMVKFEVLKSQGRDWTQIIWPLAFSAPFAITYGILSALGLQSLMPVAWAPSGGVSFLIIGLTMERELVSRRLLYARPFLATGALALAASVPVLYVAFRPEECAYLVASELMWSWSAGPLSAMLLASASYLIISLAASIYTLMAAERAILRP